MLFFSRRPDAIRALEHDCSELARCKPGDVPAISALLQHMIVKYYEDVRYQARFAFNAACGLELVAVSFFVVVAYLSLELPGELTNPETWLVAVGGTLTQLMTAVVFYLYAQSAKQFAAFHICLERTNRFLLANALVEHLPEEERSERRTDVIKTILSAPMLTLEMIEKGRSSVLERVRGFSAKRQTARPGQAQGPTMRLPKDGGRQNQVSSDPGRRAAAAPVS
jgi:hypothetical protein